MTAILAVVVSLVAIPMPATAVTPPTQTSANQPSGWPKEFHVANYSQVVIGDDLVASVNCNGAFPTFNSMTVSNFKGTAVSRSITPPQSVSKASCVDPQTSNASTGYVIGADGSMYTNAQLSSGVWQLEKYKNGRQLWAVNIPTSSPDNCAYYGGYTDYNLIMQSMSIGSDGNIYGLLRSNGMPSGCGIWLAGFNSQTGAQVFSPVRLSTSHASGVTPRVWTYESNLLVSMNNGTMRTFGYDGVEDTSKVYTLTPPPGYSLMQAIADASENVYGVFATGSNYSKVIYYDGGTAGSAVSTPFTDYSIPKFSLGGDGKLVTVSGGYIYHIDIAGSTSTADAINLPSSYTYQTVLGYMEDVNGVGVLIRQVSTSSSYASGNAIQVDTIDPSTAAYTNIFKVAANADLSFNPTTDPTAVFDSTSVYGNNLYLPICYTNTGCTNDPGTQDLSLYKIALTGIDEVVSSSNAQYPFHVSTGRNFIAMGDSYSSGEGIEPFIYGTDISNGNKCHQSKDSYPMLLDSDASTDLNLTADVACSGAMISDLLGTISNSGIGSWSSAPQVDVLNSSTKVVTLTIGGNDIGFKDYMTTCVALACGPVTAPSVYNPVKAAITSSSFSSKLIATYKTILSDAPAADLYVADYPNLTSSSTVTCDAVDLTGSI